ncbi:MAG: hypothetical protein E6Q34_06185 [Burkholderiaceae bacterium]|nr:MAG: hypothetical protein E6Q34_06185 [Burkholderiaceae bacterium]
MESNNPPNFITLDVEIVSDEDLTLLANYFEKSAFVLGNQQVGDLYYLSLEPGWSDEEKTPESCARFFVEAIATLPRELKELWDRAKSRTFDFGFESGNVQPYYRGEISQQTLVKVVAVGASVTITIYQLSSPEEGSA